MASVFKRRGGKKWCIAYTDENGARRTITGAASKTVTEQIAAKLESEAELRRRGIIDTRLDRDSTAEKKPLVVRNDEGEIVGGHLSEFHAAIEAKGATAKHAFEVRGKAVRIIERCGAERISDLTPSAVQATIQALRDDDLSLQTCNHYLRAIKQFSRWLWRDGRIREDTLAHLSGYNVKLDRRHDRRALTDDELVRLIDAAEYGPIVGGLSGSKRAVLYRLAVGTGFRANELRSLTLESFDLDADPPTVTVAAGYSKRRRRDEQPIRVDLAGLLRAYLADKPKSKAVFRLPDKPGKMLRADLEAAGIPYRDGAGRVVDFHALRHTFISNIVRSGAGVKVCQELARHSDPKLTLGVYTHLEVADKTKALDALPSVRTDKPDGETAMATGTHDVTANQPTSLVERCAAHAQRAGAPKGDSVLPHATNSLSGVKQETLANTRKDAILQGETSQAPVAQLDSASVFGTEGWGFESLRARIWRRGSSSISKSAPKGIPPWKRQFSRVYRQGCWEGLRSAGAADSFRRKQRPEKPWRFAVVRSFFRG